LQLLGGMEGAHMPGDRRYANRERHSVEGISVKQAVHAKCLEFCQTSE